MPSRQYKEMRRMFYQVVIVTVLITTVYFLAVLLLPSSDNSAERNNDLTISDATLNNLLDEDFPPPPSPSPSPSSKMLSTQIFYYPWYGGKEEEYFHWSHEILKNPMKKGDENGGRYEAPDEIGSNFYPLLGCYSSQDEGVIGRHLEMMEGAGVDAVSVSWYPPNDGDEQVGKKGYSDAVFPLLLDVAERMGSRLKFNVHIEPFQDRTAASTVEAISYCLSNYGSHSAFFRTAEGKSLFYVYDSYRIPTEEWAASLGRKSKFRNAFPDVLVIALILDIDDVENAKLGGFDGVYTYFAADGFTSASSIRNWGKLAQKAAERDLIFIPSIGPGYIDTRIRPWNAKTTRDRKNGDTLRNSFNTLIDIPKSIRPQIISITSFNEWHEGTQIEPAIPKTSSNSFSYLDYSPNDPYFYLNLTLSLIQNYQRSF